MFIHKVPLPDARLQDGATPVNVFGCNHSQWHAEFSTYLKITAYNIILNTSFQSLFKTMMITMPCYHSICFSSKKLTLG
jgi:hypothetical protein